MIRIGCDMLMNQLQYFTRRIDGDAPPVCVLASTERRILLCLPGPTRYLFFATQLVPIGSTYSRESRSVEPRRLQDRVSLYDRSIRYAHSRERGYAAVVDELLQIAMISAASSITSFRDVDLFLYRAPILAISIC